MDEHIINKDFVEQMGEAFDEAFSAGNIESCRKIIDAVKEVDQIAANALIDDLYNKPFPINHTSSLLWI